MVKRGFKSAMLRRVILALCLVGGATAASGAVYSSQSAYFAADPQLTFVSFTGMTDKISAAGEVTRMRGVALSATYPTFVSTNFWGSVDSFLADKFSGTITLSFHNRLSVGFYFGTGYDGDTPADVTVFSYGRPVYAATLWGGGVDSQFAFFGIDDVGPITGIMLDARPYAKSFVSIADISTGVEVPEPATWVLLVAGFGAVGARRRLAAHA